MKRRVMAAIVVAATLAPASLRSSGSPAWAAGGSELRLVGSRTSSVDVVLRQATTFDLTRSASSGGGSFVGFYIEAIDRPVADRDAEGTHVGLVTMGNFHGPGEQGISISLGLDVAPTLQPGRYRAYLIADGPASVSVPMRGSRSLRLSPKRPERAVAAVQTDILESPVSAGNRQGIRLAGPRTLAVSSIIVGRFRAYAGQIAACITKPEAACGQSDARGADGTYTGWIVSPLNDTGFTFTLEYRPGVLKPGSYDAVQDALNAGTFQFASGAAFALDLS